MDGFDIHSVIEQLDDVIQSNLENVMLKKEIEQLHIQIQKLQNLNSNLNRANNSLKETNALQSIELQNLKNELHHEKLKSQELQHQ